jgi:DNA-binding transcriptional ArsR family regulator
MKMDPVLFAKAIADETRQKIMSECCCCWLSVNEIVEKVGFSQPTIPITWPSCVMPTWSIFVRKVSRRFIP